MRLQLDKLFVPVLLNAHKSLPPNIAASAQRAMNRVTSELDAERRRKDLRRALVVMAHDLPRSLTHFWTSSNYRVFGDGGANAMYRHDKSL